MTADHPLADPRLLVGAWELQRAIHDRAGDQGGEVTGRLDLDHVAEDRLRWRETGVWHHAGGDLDVRRELAVVLTGDGWWVRFEDGRDFHPWTPGEQVVHPCSPDTYAGLVEGDPRAWSVRWQVTGPRKDYTMQTQLTRPAG